MRKKRYETLLPENQQFFVTFKATLLERFEQIEIYVASYAVDILLVRVSHIWVRTASVLPGDFFVGGCEEKERFGW